MRIFERLRRKRVVETAKPRPKPDEVWSAEPIPGGNGAYVLRDHSVLGYFYVPADADLAVRSVNAALGDRDAMWAEIGEGMNGPPLAETALPLVRTERGFARGAFVDLSGQYCSLQESSRGDEAAIWLGVDQDVDGKAGNRMHLTRERVASLLPHLTHFVETGLLPAGDVL